MGAAYDKATMDLGHLPPRTTHTRGGCTAFTRIGVRVDGEVLPLRAACPGGQPGWVASQGHRGRDGWRPRRPVQPHQRTDQLPSQAALGTARSPCAQLLRFEQPGGQPSSAGSTADPSRSTFVGCSMVLALALLVPHLSAGVARIGQNDPHGTLGPRCCGPVLVASPILGRRRQHAILGRAFLLTEQRRKTGTMSSSWVTVNNWRAAAAILLPRGNVECVTLGHHRVSWGGQLGCCCCAR